MTGGRGPDACIDAVGMEATAPASAYVYDRVKQAMYMESDRGQALREAITACRKGGVLSILGVYGVMDKFPIGTIMNKEPDGPLRPAARPEIPARLLEHARKANWTRRSGDPPVLPGGLPARLRDVQAQGGRVRPVGLRSVMQGVSVP